MFHSVKQERDRDYSRKSIIFSSSLIKLCLPTEARDIPDSSWRDTTTFHDVCRKFHFTLSSRANFRRVVRNFHYICFQLTFSLELLSENVFTFFPLCLPACLPACLLACFLLFPLDDVSHSHTIGSFDPPLFPYIAGSRQVDSRSRESKNFKNTWKLSRRILHRGLKTRRIKLPPASAGCFE